mmetsp:Transcript_93672/g.190682  ORF Transcript_93672/g.190682 Transcript_93672/m.190682 type:complete len:254 (+) Transcript_93672:1-762(+)
MKFEADLDGFFSGTGGKMVNLSPGPSAIGSSLEGAIPAPDAGAGREEGSQGGGAAALGMAAAAASAASALMGGKLGLVGGAVDTVVTAAVPTSLQPVKEQACRFLGKSRPWRDFLMPLSVPPGRDCCSRVTANIYNFQTNYAVLFVLQLVLAILLEPSALVCIGVTAAAWVVFLKKNDDPEWTPKLGSTELGPMQRWLLMVASTALVLLFVVGGVIFHTTMFYLTCALAHGVLHDPSAQGIPGSGDSSSPVPL